MARHHIIGFPELQTNSQKIDETEQKEVFGGGGQRSYWGRIWYSRASALRFSSR